MYFSRRLRLPTGGFDAPVTSENRHMWRTDPFYEDDASWLADLPIRTVQDFHAVMPKTHRLVLISGESFHDEMCMLSQALSSAMVEHVFHFGWIEEGLRQILEPGVAQRGERPRV